MPSKLVMETPLEPRATNKQFCATSQRKKPLLFHPGDREILLSVGMLSHYPGAGERNFSNFVILVRKIFEIFIIICTLLSTFTQQLKCE